MQLKLDKTEVMLTNLNIRRERHGEEERVVGVDLNIAMDTTAVVLDKLQHNMPITYQKLLYDKEGNRRFTGFSAIKFETEFEKHIVKLNYSVDDANEKEFQGVNLGKFNAEIKSGNLVELKFQLQLNPTDEQTHWLTDGYHIELWEIEVLGAMQSEMDLEEPQAA